MQTSNTQKQNIYLNTEKGKKKKQQLILLF